MFHDLPNSGNAGPTFQIAGTDAAQDLSDYYNSAVDGKPAIGCLITCEDNDVRFTFGGTIPTTAVGHVLGAGQSLIINNGGQVRSFQFINETQQSDALLTVTMFFELGVA